MTTKAEILEAAVSRQNCPTLISEAGSSFIECWDAIGAVKKDQNGQPIVNNNGRNISEHNGEQRRFLAGYLYYCKLI